MKLILLNKTSEYENKHASIKEIFDRIEKELSDSSFLFSHLVVDGVNVHENHADYLTKNINQIQEINVEAKQAKDFVYELIVETDKYLNNMLPEINRLVDEFYQGENQSSWEKFQQLVQGLQWINQMISVINQGKYKPENWDQYLGFNESLQQELKSMEEALKNSDTILLADVMQYELVPILEAFQKNVELSITQEGEH